MAWFPRNIFNQQRGAMFSLDARIVLLIAGILSTVAGYQTLAKIDENRYTFTQDALSLIKNATQEYYTEQGLLTNDIQADLILQGYISNPEVTADGWNNNFVIQATKTMTLINNVDIPVEYLIVYSTGRDQISNFGDANIDTAYELDTLEKWQNWQPEGDDIGFMFTTLPFVTKKVAVMNEQLQKTQSTLIAFAQNLIAKTRQDCSWTTAEMTALTMTNMLAITTVNGNTATGQQHICDFNYDGTIDSEEFLQLNYYPQVAGEGNAQYRVQASRAILGSSVPDTSYVVATISDLLEVLNLPESYGTTDLGLSLCYDSNIGDKTKPPYQAGVWYTESCTLGNY